MDPRLKNIALEAGVLLGAQAPVAQAPSNRKIRILGDPVLREVCKPVTSLTQVPGLLLYDMAHIIRELNAYGISAPQLGYPFQICMFRTQFDKRYPSNPLIVINPTNIQLSPHVRLAEEGCLSIPNFYGQITRSTTIEFEYQDSELKKQSVTLDGVAARVAQHELDHLRGKLIIDYVSRQQRRAAERAVAAFAERPARKA